MTTKAAFNAEEWSVVTSAPLLTAMLVIASDKGGTVRESLAMSEAYALARAQQPRGLMTAVLETPPALAAGAKPKGPDELREVAPATLRRAVALLERLATQDEVVAYKRFVYGMADRVARAHREGGFLGIGGTEVSQHEQAALDQIAAIFDEPPRV